jgi:hypothetical protein
MMGKKKCMKKKSRSVIFECRRKLGVHLNFLSGPLGGPWKSMMENI